MFLHHWQTYVNETSITPAQPNGPIRHGGDPDVVSAGRVASLSLSKHAHSESHKASDVKAAPSSTRTVELLAGKFREILRGSGKAVS